MLAWCHSGYWISTGLHKIGILAVMDLDGYKQPSVKIRLFKHEDKLFSMGSIDFPKESQAFPSSHLLLSS